ncbi:hypothetical protein Aoc01nite_64800 [Actinoplanes octamycinicus]|nr:hypothetical protein Aoc01nite_64800 [Actinoplanes octamycinicus]
MTWQPLIRAFGLVAVPLPVKLPAPPIVCCWHQRYDTDPAHIWLRDRVRAAFTTVLTRGPAGTTCEGRVRALFSRA